MLNLDSIVSYREDIDTTDIDEDKVCLLYTSRCV